MSDHTSEHALTAEQKSHFLQHGFVKIPKCFTRKASATFTSTLWTRLGVSESDPRTWTTLAEKTNMPSHNSVEVSVFAPKAWSAICELVGGEDRIADWTRVWRDSFIVNLGLDSYSPDDSLKFRELGNWHTDGDFFVHFLDSPEQALLVIPLFSDIGPKGGGTVICSDGVGLIARHLYSNPEGVTPWMAQRDTPEATDDHERRAFWKNLITDPSLTQDKNFHEVTGEIGDVYLLHPLMLHSASKNLLRKPRIITNPPVSLKEPFNFSRRNPAEFSLIEQKTLNELGKSGGLGGWKITGPRARVVPRRVKVQEEMKARESERMKLLEKR